MTGRERRESMLDPDLRPLDAAGMSVFSVYVDGPNWVVKRRHYAGDYRFPDREKALSFARTWAHANRPSLLKLEHGFGDTEKEWVYVD